MTPSFCFDLINSDFITRMNTLNKNIIPNLSNPDMIYEISKIKVRTFMNEGLDIVEKWALTIV